MMRARIGREQVYRRQLPGGGFVAIEVTPIHSRSGPPRYHGELVVERRATRERRAGHRAPAMAEVDAPSVSSVLQQLFPLAASNSEIARRCLARARDVDPAVLPLP